MDEIDPAFLTLEQLIIRSRLNAIALMINTSQAERLTRLTGALGGLRRGAYLLGTGPSTVGIIPLSVDEIVLGRSATPLEQPTSTLVDYTAADTLYFSPHEVSRAHAKVVRYTTAGGAEYRLIDLGSTCGTFVNGEPIPQNDSGVLLNHADVISLGPSHVSTYFFFVAEGTD